MTRILEGRSSRFWKQWAVPRGHEHEGTLGSIEDAVVGDEAEAPVEDVPHLILTSMDVPRRALLRTDDVLEERECPTRVASVGSDRRGATSRTLDQPALTPWHDERFDRTGHGDLLGPAFSGMVDADISVPMAPPSRTGPDRCRSGVDGVIHSGRVRGQRRLPAELDLNSIKGIVRTESLGHTQCQPVVGCHAVPPADHITHRPPLHDLDHPLG